MSFVQKLFLTWISSGKFLFAIDKLTAHTGCRGLYRGTEPRSLYRNAFTTYKWFRLQSPVLSICMVYIYFLIILVFNVLDKLFTFTLHAHCVATRETNSPPCQIRNRIYIILLYPFGGKQITRVSILLAPAPATQCAFVFSLI